jgi:hypothetical protein
MLKVTGIVAKSDRIPGVVIRTSLLSPDGSIFTSKVANTRLKNGLTRKTLGSMPGNG